MKRALLAIIVFGLISIPAVRNGAAQTLLETAAVAPLAVPAPTETPDAPAYADGVRAINESRWSDAIAIFSRVVAESGDHADGALFWKAYAENKLGQGSRALEDCAHLRNEHPDSKWLDECGALEIEIRGRSGQPVQPQARQSDDLRLLALATLMQHDEKRALKEIDDILNSDAPEKLKQGALFIMGEHHTDTMYPQIVRLSYVEGDVRIARGEKKKHDKGSGWEQATADLPLETGYSLVTGNGRAEIELEDASTIYMAENSVLTFNDLHTVGGIPFTDAALLTGTVTLHVKPYVAGELFLLRMPTDAVVTRYPQVTDLRVSSYTDGIAVTSFGKGSLGLNGEKAAQDLGLGKTYYFKNGKRTIDAGPIQAPDFSAWDKWVSERYTARTTAQAEMLKASGLPAPIPGLADMAGKGRFVDCEPYGTCWEPPAPPAQPAEGNDQVAEAKPADAGQGPASQSPATPGAKPARNIRFVGKPTPTRPPAEWAQMMYMFPCVPGEVEAQLIQSLYPGVNVQTFYSAYLDPPAWTWAVCHSGSWIYNQNRYMWVAGKRHHHPPIHWIRYGNKVGFVPVHPRDVKDRPPVNHKNPVFAVNPKGGSHLIERVEFPTGRPVELLKEPPHGLRMSYAPPLVRADEPRMTAHPIRDVTISKGIPAKATPIPIVFDHRTQTFVTTHQEMHGNRPVTVTAPINNRGGTLQPRAGGFGNASSGAVHAGGGVGGGAHPTSTSTATPSSAPHSAGPVSSPAPAPSAPAAASHH